MRKIQWYINRFKTMSPAETGFRLFQALRYMAERYRKSERLHPFSKVVTVKRLLPDYVVDPQVRFPERIFIFGMPFDFSAPVNWHHDILSDHDFPQMYTRDIDIRTSKYGSAKVVWEINRMLFLPWYCINYRSTGDRYYLDQFKEKITGWIRQNAYLTGVNWHSNIEVNIRLINWLICWEILEAERMADADPEFRKFLLEQWLPLIHRHCRYSYSNPSLYSSANNHRIAEYSGLFLAALKWDFPESNKWQKYARRGLEKEIQRQHSARGINREEAAEYIQFITDFFLIPFIAARNTGKDFSSAYAERLESIFRYIYEFTDKSFRFPQYGDEDDGKVLLLSASESFNNFTSLLISGALLFGDKKMLSGIRETDVKNILLFGNRCREVFSGWLASVPPVRHSQGVAFYEEEGHYIIKDTLDSGKEIYLHIDAAPLGYLSIAAHGHADALSFILHFDGYPFFIDSGTYTYHTDPEFRKYFIGTLAHNTVRVNQSDQAMNGGPTLWISKYRVSQEKAIHDSNPIIISAQHDGYRSHRIIHGREFRYDRAEKALLITDTLILEQNRETVVEIPFHLHPDVQVTLFESGVFRLHNSRGDIQVSTDPQLQYRVACGESDPILGWYSPSFYVKQAARVLYGRASISKTTVFKTGITIMNG